MPLAPFLYALAALSPQEDDVFKTVFKTMVQPILQKHCFGCHGNQTKPKADLNLTKYTGEKSIQENRKIWTQVLIKLHTRAMPPEGEPQPTVQERQAVTDFVEAALRKIDGDTPTDPGRVVARRLNRAEYKNTIRDLTGVAYNPAADFPADDVGYGFDNIGDVLSLPPLLMEKYVAATKKIVDEAVASKLRLKYVFPVTPADAKTPRDAARECLTRFIGRAFRRPVAGEEVEKYLKLFDLAEKTDLFWEGAMRLPLRAILLSPHFLFRVESEGAGDIWRVSEFELASRLSYFLWASMPDDELLDQARKGQLRKNLEPQVLRMLKDPKAFALAEHFAPQWLQVRRLDEMKFDPRQFPSWDNDLKDAMIGEVIHFFDAVVKEDRSVLDFLDADFTVANGRLAQFYGLSGVSGQGFRKVQIGAPRRGGILTMAAVLASTSDPNRTSPVKRGKWVLETVLATPPPPPIPDAANLKEEGSLAGLTLRQKMERHRQDPNCAGCHKRMDPIGFGFENFDAIGAWRDRDGGRPIDASAELPDGRAFNGPVELKNLLKAQKDEFVKGLSEKLLTYALGRGVEHFDGPAVKEVADAAAKKGYKISALGVELVKSFPFQYRSRDRGKDR